MNQYISSPQSASVSATVEGELVILTIAGENEGDFAAVTMGVGTALTIVREIQAAAAEASINAMTASMMKGNGSE